MSKLVPVRGDMGGPQVCLATGFYPDVSDDVIINSIKTVYKELMVSPKSHSYTHATLAQGESITVCEVEEDKTNTNIPTTAYPTTRPTPVAVNTTSGPTPTLENVPEVFNEELSDNSRLSSYYLLINGLRHILTKTLVLNVLVVLRGLV